MSYEKDLYNGSEYTRALRNSQRTRARIRGLVSLSGTANVDQLAALKNAADQAVSAKGLTHPDNAQLPLQVARARMAGSAHAITDLFYYRTESSETSLDPFDLPTIRGGVRSRSVLKYVGTSGGDFSVGTAHFREFFRTEGILQISAPWSRVNSPLSAVPEIYTINGDDLTWSGKAFGTATLRFDAPEQNAFELNGTTRFDGFYHFSFNKLQWTRDEPAADNTYGTTHVGTVLEYPTATFGGNFPV